MLISGGWLAFNLRVATRSHDCFPTIRSVFGNDSPNTMVAGQNASKQLAQTGTFRRWRKLPVDAGR